MSTITPTPETETEQVLPPALWRAFRDERRMGSKQREAMSHAFEKVGIRKSDTRERLAELLFAKESADGLALTSREIEAEAAPDGPAEPEKGSLEAIQADALERLETLSEQRARLAPEALTDAAAKAEMANLEAEIAAAQQALDLVEVARGETGRREREASEAAARAGREQGETAAAKLQPQIAKAAQRVDTAASVFAESVTAYRDLREQQSAAVARSGRGAEATRSRRFRPEAAAASLFAACRERGLKLEGFEGSRRDAPLAGGEPAEWS